MPYTRRWKWLQAATGTKTVRAAATKVGVNHGTVSRWLNTGMPIERLVELVVKFECDPVEALVVWGFIPEEALPRLNWCAVARYMPTNVLTGEAHRRATEYLESNPDPLVKTSVGMLRRA